MIRNNKCLGLVIAVLLFSSATAQRRFYSQWNGTPLLINPAYTGYFNENMRLSAGYRYVTDQNSPEQRMRFVAFEAKPFQNMLNNDVDEWSLGLVSNKHTGLNGIYSFSTIGISTSYRKALDMDGANTLSLGFQYVMHSEKSDLGALDFTNQFGPGGFDRSLPNYEPMETYTHNYSDLNVGVMYSSDNEIETFFIGLAGQQLNSSKKQLNTTATFQPVLDLSVGYTRYINERYVFTSIGNFTFNAPVNEKNVMAGFGTALTELETDMLFAGAYFRFNEILSPFIQYQKEGFKLTLSYDTYSSAKINGIKNRKALEITAAFRFSSRDDQMLKKLDCFR